MLSLGQSGLFELAGFRRLAKPGTEKIINGLELKPNRKDEILVSMTQKRLGQQTQVEEKKYMFNETTLIYW
jgi:hypothetical protein